MKANAVGKMYSEVSRAYLAGLIDGDGAIMATIEKHREKKFKFRVRLQIKITQKENILLSYLAKTYRVGILRANRKGTKDQTFDWIVLDKKDIAELLDLISPYTKTKIKQIVLAKKILKLSDATKQGLMKMARLADALSKFNVRSKSRRKNYAIMIKESISSND